MALGLSYTKRACFTVRKNRQSRQRQPLCTISSALVRKSRQAYLAQLLSQNHRSTVAGVGIKIIFLYFQSLIDFHRAESKPLTWHIFKPDCYSLGYPKLCKMKNSLMHKAGTSCVKTHSNTHLDYRHLSRSWRWFGWS